MGMPVYHGGHAHKGKGFSDRNQKKTADITCSKCDKKAKVRYVPDPEKKQYCKNCYIRL